MAGNQNKILRIISVSALVILLGACSAAMEKEPEVTGMNDDRYHDSGYGQLATEMSNANVQLYDFDGNEAPARPREREDRIVRGMSTNDPSVTVFSLDDGTPVGQGFQGQKQQNINDYNARRYDAVPVPYNPPEDASDDSDGNFVPMTRKVPSQKGREDVSQFNTMPNRIYFPHDSAQLTNSGHEVIGHVVKAYQGQELSVEGHASERAEQEKTVERKITNLKVSMDRALSVSRALMHKGVPAESIETKAYGDTKPPLVSQGMSPESAARRVEIYSR